MSRVRVCLWLIASLCITINAMATTHLVRPDGTGDFPTIQDAVLAAADLDTILLASGTYRGEGNRDIQIEYYSLVITSETGLPTDCVIDCEGTSVDPHRGFIIHTVRGRGPIFDGLTVEKAYVPDSDICAGGGAIITLPSTGEGPFHITVRNCHFVKNRAQYGGAINCATMDEVITGCRFVQNEAETGGAILCAGWSSFITDCEFIDNVAANGGAFRISSSSTTINRCLFLRNWANVWGGALLADGGGDPCILNCTFVGNVAVHRGSAIMSRHSNHLPVHASIIAFGDGAEPVYCDFGGTFDLSCCNMFANDGSDWPACIAAEEGQDGNFSSDPLFCDVNADDLYLSIDSPCAPSPDQECGLIGAFPVGCSETSVEIITWGGVKARSK